MDNEVWAMVALIGIYFVGIIGIILTSAGVGGC